MRLNADFDRRVAIHAASQAWQPSPMPGVERRMLERIGGEIARATSIVRYAPGSAFAPHIHGGGEEFLVLEGIFQDEHGDYPVGQYVRNPPGTRHSPRAESGCVLFVKLWQFDPADTLAVNVASAELDYLTRPGEPRLWRAELHADATERVTLEVWEPGTTVEFAAPGGLELLVLEGELSEAAETFRYLSWLRLPPGALLHASAGEAGCRLWMKQGHLKSPRLPPG